MGGTCDKKRGICHCEEGFSGPGCENKSCPNSNGVLYPFNSANACNGRGACDVETGKCACTQPYYGDSCRSPSAQMTALVLEAAMQRLASVHAQRVAMDHHVNSTLAPRTATRPLVVTVID